MGTVIRDFSYLLVYDGMRRGMETIFSVGERTRPLIHILDFAAVLNPSHRIRRHSQQKLNPVV
jgi:hypothetical protein